jgi:ABC-2 type transport system ATP-binding protein
MKDTPRQMPPATIILDVQDLTKRYGETEALRGVSFQVKQDEIFGLLGPNGAGKTTLLSILSCLLEPSSGTAHLLGRPLRRQDREIRRHIGIVPQELALYGELTARENLRFFGELYGVHNGRLAQKVDEVLTLVGLQDRAAQRVDTFSGGMKRRLNLGAALVHEPRLLLLDEPTIGVDPQSRNHIFEEIQRVQQSGVTIIYTSHYMEEVQSLCTRVGIMDQGRLIACDTLSALLQQMEGLIRLRISESNRELAARIEQLPGVRLSVPESGLLELECHDVKGTLIRVLALLNELQVELISLETEEPNLQRVFLHMTGRALRD